VLIVAIPCGLFVPGMTITTHRGDIWGETDKGEISICFIVGETATRAQTSSHECRPTPLDHLLCADVLTEVSLLKDKGCFPVCVKSLLV